MPIDNQLWLARVGIYNTNQLHHFTSLKTNPPGLDICFILSFLNFYMITVCLILLTYFSSYLILTQVRNHGFSIKKFDIANVLFTKNFYFYYCAFNRKRMLLLESGDIETRVL